MASPGDRRTSPNIDYKTSLNQLWSATWVGDQFHHVPKDPAFGLPHDDIWMNYKTWNNSNWWAKWNPATKHFVHVAAAGADGGPTGASHEDIILNYVTWDGSKWTALRDGNNFVHICVAGSDDTSSSIFGQVLHGISVMGNVIDVIVEAAPMVKGT